MNGSLFSFLISRGTHSRTRWSATTPFSGPVRANTKLVRSTEQFFTPTLQRSLTRTNARFGLLSLNPGPIQWRGSFQRVHQGVRWNIEMKNLNWKSEMNIALTASSFPDFANYLIHLLCTSLPHTTFSTNTICIVLPDWKHFKTAGCKSRVRHDGRRVWCAARFCHVPGRPRPRRAADARRGASLVRTQLNNIE